MNKSNFWKIKILDVNQYNHARFAIYNSNEERISNNIFYDIKLLDDIVQKHNEEILDYVL